MPVEFKKATIEIQGKDETNIRRTIFVDADGKLRTGIVEYIKLIAQHNALDGITVAGTTYNHILAYPSPFHSNVVGNDYEETALSVTAAAGTTASATGSVSATFVSNLRNRIVKVRGDVLVVVTYYYSNTDADSVTVDSIDVEFGILKPDGTTTALGSKSVTINRSASAGTSVTESLVIIFQDKEFSLTEGDRLYLTVTVNATITETAPATASSTGTGAVRIHFYRGTDDTYMLLPVVM